MKLTELKGIGTKTEEAFKKAGIESAEDLLEFFPRDYEVFHMPVTVSEIGYRTFAAVRGCFASPLVNRFAGRLKMTTGVFRDEIGGSIRVTWFNAPYMKDNIQTGQIYILRGRISRKYSTLQLDQPRVYTPEDYQARMGTLTPVYPLSKGLTNNVITKAVQQALNSPQVLETAGEDMIPSAVLEKYGLCSRKQAIYDMHFPADEYSFSQSVKRMSFEEIFLFLLTMKKNEDNLQKKSSFIIYHDPETQAMLNNLPFELTDAQKNVISQISADMSSGNVMNRLIQGDVGSGKTMVAISAMTDAAMAGYQSALMVPTEVLAEQHYKTISNLYRDSGVNVRTALLTGSMTQLEKQVVYDALERGRINIVIGTHALFQEKVNYNNLALVVTDEQHRFGIKQREALAQKGKMPHTIVMSATPIPRTLALIMYGNMDVSTIDQLPASRKPIKNAVVNDSYRENAYRLIEREARAGHQIYIICPLVSFSEGLDAANVEDYTAMLRETLSEDISIGMLHGQMAAEKKNEIMARFAAGKIQVLVSTTVIEVGVDAPNATVIMIEDADRFGLATLHQLRGRVGRGDAQSYCIFMCNKNSREAMERLEILKTSNDGFEIASKDLSMRGPGEFMGTRQSGAFNFSCFDVSRDMDIAMNALEAANDIIAGKIPLSKNELASLEGRIQILKSGIVL